MKTALQRTGIKLFVLSVLLGALPTHAAPVPPEKLFGPALIKAMKISPDGRHVAVTHEEGSEVRLAVMELGSRKMISAFEFGANQHVLNFWWGSDTRVVMSVGEVTGNLDNQGRPSHLYAANIDGTRRQQIFEMERSWYQVLHSLPDDPDHILIARYHYADGGEPKANLLDIHNGDLDYLAGQPVDEDMRNLVADSDGNLIGAVAVEQGDALDETEIRLYLRTGEEWERFDVESVRPSPALYFMGTSADNREVYIASNHDMPKDDRLGVFRLDLESRKAELVFRHDIVDVRGLIESPGGKVMGAWASFGPASYTLFEDQVQAFPDDAGLLSGLLRSFPENNAFVTSSTRDGNKAIIYVTGDRNPGEYYLFDTQARRLSFLSAAHADIDKEALLPMETVRITARDGLVLNAFLTRPAEQPEALPLILNVHGGPFGPYDAWGFNDEAQYFAQHGYAHLQVNFRGSGNRGEDFERAGWRQWGGAMQDDLVDAVQWAVDQGIADPDRVCIYGGSYGGYAALMGVVKTPDLYQCAVGYVGVYDLPLFRSGDGSDFSRGMGRVRRENFERFMSSAVGEDPESLKAHSPVHHVDKIEAELYLVHGGSDVRVPIVHFERLRAALDAIGKDYEWMVKDKEGHGFYDTDNRVELYTSMLAFFDRHIGPKSP